MTFDRFLPATAFALAAGLFAAGSLAVTPARAADDTNTFNSVLGFFGMQFDKEEEATIDYRARAPLVVPPKLDLPRPEQASNHPQDWPTDPDVAARRKALADSHRPAPQITPNTRPEMTKEQLMAVRGEPMPVVVDEKSESCAAMGGSSSCGGSTWQYVTQKLGLTASTDEKVVLSGAEPPRKYLTEPPPGYRKPTATTHVVADKAKSEIDSGDAHAYTRGDRHKSSVDE